MQGRRDEIAGGSDPFARYPPSEFATLPMGLAALLVEEKVGRNGWAVVARIISYARREYYANGTFRYGVTV